MKVSGSASRPLGGTAGDRKTIESIAASAVRHFACPERRRAHRGRSTRRHDGTAWQLQALRLTRACSRASG